LEWEEIKVAAGPLRGWAAEGRARESSWAAGAGTEGRL